MSYNNNQTARLTGYLLKNFALQEFEIDHAERSAGLFGGEDVSVTDRYCDGCRPHLGFSEQRMPTHRLREGGAQYRIAVLRHTAVGEQITREDGRPKNARYVHIRPHLKRLAGGLFRLKSKRDRDEYRWNSKSSSLHRIAPCKDKGAVARGILKGWHCTLRSRVNQR